jgi:hypothetical protein
VRRRVDRRELRLRRGGGVCEAACRAGDVQPQVVPLDAGSCGIAELRARTDLPFDDRGNAGPKISVPPEPLPPAPPSTPLGTAVVLIPLAPHTPLPCPATNLLHTHPHTQILAQPRCRRGCGCTPPGGRVGRVRSLYADSRRCRRRRGPPVP